MPLIHSLLSGHAQIRQAYKRIAIVWLYSELYLSVLGLAYGLRGGLYTLYSVFLIINRIYCIFCYVVARSSEFTDAQTDYLSTPTSYTRRR